MHPHDTPVTIGTTVYFTDGRDLLWKDNVAFKCGHYLFFENPKIRAATRIENSVIYMHIRSLKRPHELYVGINRVREDDYHKYIKLKNRKKPAPNVSNYSWFKSTDVYKSELKLSVSLNKKDIIPGFIVWKKKEKKNTVHMCLIQTNEFKANAAAHGVDFPTHIFFRELKRLDVIEKQITEAKRLLKEK